MTTAPFPSRIVLELTPLCNLACHMCPRHYIKESDGYMDCALFKRLVDEIAAHNPQAIVLPFWRGESCLHPEFATLLQYAIDKGLRIHLSTNGHFISEQNCAVFYQCEFLTFSIHTNKGYENAQKILANKSKDCATTFQISFVDSEKTTAAYLQHCVSDNNLLGFDSIRLYKEHTLNGEFGKSSASSARKRVFCPKLLHTFVVSSDGYFSRCNHIWKTQKEHNLHDESIAHVWQCETMQAIRRDYPDSQCAPCDQWSGHTCGESWQNHNGTIVHNVFD